jgi:ABC-2 type transport system ATP-binding protein
MLTTRVIPTSGHAYVNGIDVVAHPTAAKQVIGVVPQTNTLDRSLSLRENLYFHGRFFGMSSGVANAESVRLLEQFRLSDRGNDPVGALSGGMAQRLMVARAIMHRPAILFLDEPTAGLDPQSRLALWEILGELHAAGQTILLTTHYMEEADALCDRLAIIDRGHLLALGTPAELKATIGADTVISVSAQGDLDALAELLRGGVPDVADVTRVDSTVVVETRAKHGVVPTVFELAERNGFTISDVSVNEPTLETVFINLTGKDLRE